ncbi:leucine-tRNA ligase [Cyphellophora europaea CBS 101466]|uniref:leucine--tRNA ligase n=1 Tax=Cyphellophora europaea (strain CBS 101466) TaxID=1220924 RepID=W2SAE3_CYPE1|nr:leucine-tRNA ligase [Cyphellophora europaea CBS 101466]ETN45605.1 leucine-tRNA ligase [Cyphellophora europaea CBS 101466]
MLGPQLPRVRLQQPWSKGVGVIRCLRLRNASRLSFPEIDAKWQQRWAQEPLSREPERTKKTYVLPMFAYPSGSLHMGHLRVYTISDVIARYRRMQGYSVLHPTGWDAFGLPAENAAIERGLDPGVWTEENIAKMKAQLKSMNTSFDWDAEISTCDPSFYKHTQRLFLMLHKRGLAYQANALVNWDPVDKTVLANEQVDSNGKSWRSGATVQQINLRQWFFAITEFKEALLDDLDFLSTNGRWPERVITQQRNWLGKSSGARLRIDVQHPDGHETSHYVFTTRPDTIYGVKYLAVALTHSLTKAYQSLSPELQILIDEKASLEVGSKAGVPLPLKARIPSVSDDFNLSVFAAPYVLEGYGEGAVMGVPAHDARDLAFWKQHRPDEEIPVVIQPPASLNTKLRVQPGEIAEAYTDPGILTSLCGKYADMESTAAAAQITSDLTGFGPKGARHAERFDTWRLRDWLVSRQRYWGAPIPIIHCRSCGTVSVPEEDLPVRLPQLDDSMKGQRGNPLEKMDSWVNVSCPSCGDPAKRETDTMDTFVDSSWYYGRFTDPNNNGQLFSEAAAASRLPVDTYVGGVEHAILHLLYARFIYKFLCSEGLIPDHAPEAEPFQQLVAQGMVHGKTFSDPESGRFLRPEEVDHSSGTAVVKASGEQANISFEKMSKSKYNGVDPSICITKYGADATRAHILFTAPVSEVLQWDEEKIVGVQRWFGRIQRLASDLSSQPMTGMDDYTMPTSFDLSTLSTSDISILLTTQSTVMSVTKTFDHDIYSLNTTISDLIKLTNLIHDAGVGSLAAQVARVAISALLRMLAPIAPAFAEECWENINNLGNASSSSIFHHPWPQPPLSEEQEVTLKASHKTMTCAVQINGKLRFTAAIPTASEVEARRKTASEVRVAEVVDAVLRTDDGQTWLRERNNWEQRKRVVLVGGGKVLNIVF